MTLEVEGLSLPVAKSAPDRITLVTPTNLPVCAAVLRTMIDGRAHQRDVLLPSGAGSDSPLVRVESVSTVAGA